MSFNKTVQVLTIVVLLLTTYYLLSTTALAQEFNTPAGSNVEVVAGGATFVFPEVLEPGNTEITLSDASPEQEGFYGGDATGYYNISTTAVYTGLVEVCIPYNGDEIYYEVKVRLMHLEGDEWKDITSRLDTIDNIVCGETDTFSQFSPMVKRSIEELSHFIGKLDLNYGVRTSMFKKTRNASEASWQESDETVVNMLNSLAAQLNALSGKKIPAESADNLTNYIKNLIVLYL